eukprot:gnl/MRDRNA2_/MRDRNA2_102009_c0_seq1.p1 gnl/MRDRNA2_/MRDRNA2_102009_c0~~gnl/MRDRNA2_/MRDRNA2_102009_c0_seq1.p1  ORF type:complete len:265 (+),score=81.90 gnl/MRDRNA2_/MRDRNA2_102009_c0_seq1:104-898(+)
MLRGLTVMLFLHLSSPALAIVSKSMDMIDTSRDPISDIINMVKGKMQPVDDLPELSYQDLVRTELPAAKALPFASKRSPFAPNVKEGEIPVGIVQGEEAMGLQKVEQFYNEADQKDAEEAARLEQEKQQKAQEEEQFRKEQERQQAEEQDKDRQQHKKKKKNWYGGGGGGQPTESPSFNPFGAFGGFGGSAPAAGGFGGSAPAGFTFPSFGGAPAPGPPAYSQPARQQPAAPAFNPFFAPAPAQQAAPRAGGASAAPAAFPFFR